MKLFFKLFFCWLLVYGFGQCSLMAQSQSVNTQTVFDGIDSKQNFIKNPYARLNDLNVTCTNATKGRDASTNKLFGFASHTIDSSAQNGYCEYALNTIVAPYTTGNCEFKGVVIGDGSLYRAQILDGSANLKVQTNVFGNNSSWREFSVNYPCQSTPKVRITQTEAGTAPAINVGLYYGPATNIGNVAPPDRFSFKVSAVGTVSDRQGRLDIAPTSCVMSGTNNATGTCNFLTTLQSTPNCTIDVNSGSNNYNAQFGTGSPSASSLAYFAYAINTLTATAVPVTVICTLGNTDAPLPAILGKTQGSYSGTLSGATQWTKAGSTYTDFSSGSSVTVTKTGGSGLNCSAISGNLPGLTCTTDAPGLYNVCANATGWTSAGGSTTVAVRLADGSGNVLNSGVAVQDTTSGYAQAFSVCGIVSATETSFSVKLQGYTSTGTFTLNASTDIYRPHFTITPVLSVGQAMALNGSVIADTTVRAEKSSGATSVDYGTYSATVTGVSNVSSVTSPVTCTYSRIGTVVNVSCPGTVTCTSTSGMVDTTYTVGIPVNTSNSGSVYGAMGATYPQEVGRVVGNTSSTVKVDFKCFTGGYNRPIIFTYSTQ